MGEQVAERPAGGEGGGEGPRHRGRARFGGVAQAGGQRAGPLVPALRRQAQEDLLARLEVAQQRGLVHPHRGGDVRQRDLPDAALAAEGSRRLQDRGFALSLGLGRAGALELRCSHPPIVAQRRCTISATVFY